MNELMFNTLVAIVLTLSLVGVATMIVSYRADKRRHEQLLNKQKAERAIRKDALIIILLAIGKQDVNRLQYEMLKCGMVVPQPEIIELIQEINAHMGNEVITIS